MKRRRGRPRVWVKIKVANCEQAIAAMQRVKSVEGEQALRRFFDLSGVQYSERAIDECMRQLTLEFDREGNKEDVHQNTQRP